MTDIWTENSGYDFGEYFESASLDIPLPIYDNINGSFSIISGNLPSTCYIDQVTYSIVGTLPIISTRTVYKFCIRAVIDNNIPEIQDRTFLLTSTPNHDNEFTYTNKYLPVGTKQQYFALDNTTINYKIEAESISSVNLKFYLGSGKLPNNLSLSEDGTISGLLYTVDYTESYKFIVWATDGYIKNYIEYSIIVCSDKFFRVDNTKLNVSTGLYTADIFYVRDPIWVTDSLIEVNDSSNFLLPLEAYSSYPVYFKYSMVTSEISCTTVKIDATDNKKGNNILTVKSSTLIQAGKKLSFYNIVSIASTKIYTISSVTSLGDNCYRLTLDDNLEIFVQNSVTIYIGIESSLPDGLIFDSINSVIYGSILYQKKVQKEYRFSIFACSVSDDGVEIRVPQIFQLDVYGKHLEPIHWITDYDLGTLRIGIPCVKKVVATVNSTETINYQKTAGKLPYNVTVDNSGELIGIPIIEDDVSYESIFEFEVTASGLNLEPVTKKFGIRVDNSDVTTYSNLYVKPFLSPIQRNTWISFLEDSTIFPTDCIYRYNDPNFGVNFEQKVLILAGISTDDLSGYFNDVDYKANMVLYYDSLEIAIAKESIEKDIVYEVIYYKMLDAQNIYDSVTTTNNNAIFKWRNDIITDSGVVINNNYMPLWMNTIQTNTYNIYSPTSSLGYKLVLPICYCKPGCGSVVISNLIESGFDIKQFEYRIHSLLIEKNIEQYNLLSGKYIRIGAKKE